MRITGPNTPDTVVPENVQKAMRERLKKIAAFCEKTYKNKKDGKCDLERCILYNNILKRYYELFGNSEYGNYYPSCCHTFCEPPFYLDKWDVDDEVINNLTESKVQKMCEDLMKHCKKNYCVECKHESYDITVECDMYHCPLPLTLNGNLDCNILWCTD